MKNGSTKRTRRLGLIGLGLVALSLAALLPVAVSFAQTGISGMKFNDLNANGVRDVGEPALANWTIKAQPDSFAPNPNPTFVTTNTVGEYFFTGLPDGHYFVSEVQQSPWNQTAPPGGGYNVTIVSGVGAAGLDFGNTLSALPGSIYGYKFHDINGNGMRDSIGGQMEPLLDGWTIQLTGPVNLTTVTSGGGNFTFSNLPPATYTVSEVQQTGWIQSAPPPPGTFTVNLASGQNIFVGEFGNMGTNSIRGRKFNDINQDCIQDPGELGLPGWTIRLDPGPFYAITKANGDYIFPSLGPGTYTISEVPKQYWGQTCPVSPGTYTVTLTSGQTVTDKDFGNLVVQFVQDLAVSIWASYPSPLRTPCCGQQMTYVIRYENTGSVLVSGATLRLLLSQLTTYQSFSANPPLSSPSPTGPNEWTWNLPTPLQPGSSGLIYATVLVNCTAPASPMLVAHARLNPLAGDATAANNQMIHQAEVTCSFDPNDKAVVPKGCSTAGFITANDTLTYEIRFQNLGNGPAYQVVVRDTLDPDLGISTVAHRGSSHANVFQMNGNELVWTFPGIELPPALIDEPGSHGYITFRVNQMPNNPAGTVIENLAAIYFDLNEPVITNQTLNTVTTNPLPAASFSVVRNGSGNPYTYDFTYTGGTTGATFGWDFGYGAIPETSSVQNPMGILYNPPGFKVVFLRVRLGDCISEPAIQTLVDSSLTDVRESEHVPEKFELMQCYPNPFNPVTSIRYGLPEQSFVNLRIYDVLGREVAELANGVQPAGYHAVDFDATSLSSGIYFYSIRSASVTDQSKNFTQAKKMLLIK